MIRKILLFSLIPFLCQCVTPKGGKEAATGASSAGEMVIQQIGREGSLTSNRDRAGWISIRNANKGTTQALFATLVAGSPDVAEADARHYLKEHPGNTDALEVLALSLALQQKYDLSAYYAEVLAQKTSASALVWNLRGLAISFRGESVAADLRRSQQLFQSAIDASPTEIAAALNLGHLQLEIGNAQGAAATFDLASSRCKQCVPALLGRGIALSRSGHPQEGAAALQAILSQEADHPFALYHLALVYKNGYNDKVSAAKSLRRLLATAPSSLKTLRQKASSALRVTEAETDPKQGSSKAADDSDAGIMTQLQQSETPEKQEPAKQEEQGE